jgi:arsenate reductase (thioredoxin)
MPPPLSRRLLAEFLGSALLAALVIGSGIAAQQLSDDVGLRLLENAAATAAGLLALILIFGPVSGAHLNPVVSLVDAAFGGLQRRDVGAYIAAQVVVLGHLRRDRPGLGSGLRRRPVARRCCGVRADPRAVPGTWPCPGGRGRRPGGAVMSHVLFVCLHNAGCSQISQALFERAAAGRHTAESAGSVADPDGRVHPEVVEPMRELGIDLADRHPQRLTDALAQRADVVVTMGCGDTCPYIPGKRYIDWELPDPKGQPATVVRALREDIAGRVDALIAELEG